MSNYHSQFIHGVVRAKVHAISLSDGVVATHFVFILDDGSEMDVGAFSTGALEIDITELGTFEKVAP